MEIKLDILKTLDENATEYYERAKKIKKKIEGAELALKETLKKIEEFKQKEKETKILESKKIEKNEKRQKKWFEKFRYYFDGEFLIVGGKDATSNEVLIKKYTEKQDLVLHTDIHGSPFFVIKNGKNADEKIIANVAKICASYSRAWKENLASVDVYCINPEQISKTPKAGEYLTKGSFMIYGERKWFKNTELKIFINFNNNIISLSPVPNSEHYVSIIPGDKKAKEIVEKIKKFYEHKNINIKFEEEEIIRLIPYGKGNIKEIK